MVHYRCPGCGTGFDETAQKIDGLPVCPACQRIVERASPEATADAAGDRTSPDGILPLLMLADDAAPPIRPAPTRDGRPLPRSSRAPTRDRLNLENLWQEQHQSQGRRRTLLLSLAGIAVVCCAIVAVLNRTTPNEHRNGPSQRQASTLPPAVARVGEQFDPTARQEADDQPKAPELAAQPFPPSKPAPTTAKPEARLPRTAAPAPGAPAAPGGKSTEEEDPKMLGKVPPPLRVDPESDGADTTPDAQFPVPENLSSEVRDRIAAAAKLLHEHHAADRIRGANLLGRLGPAGRSAARDICAAMLDPNRPVAVAAANALKRIDAPLYPVAMLLVLNAPDFQVLLRALTQVRTLGRKAAALTPVLLRVLSAYTPRLAARRSVLAEVQQAERIAESCVRALAASANGDPEVSRAMFALLRLGNERVNEAVLAAIPSLKQVHEGVQSLALLMHAGQSTPIRLAAIRALLSIADRDNQASIKAILDSLRFDRNPVIRQAADTALDQLSKDVNNSAHLP